MTNALKYQGYTARVEFDAEVHAAANVAAQASGKSLNQWATDANAQAAVETAHP